MGRLHRLSGGVPRIINVLCDRALLGAYVQGKERVDRCDSREGGARGSPTAGGTARRRVAHLSQRVWFAGGRRIGGGGVSAGAAGDQNGGGKADLCEARLAHTQDESRGSAGRSRSGVGLPETLEWPADQPRSRSEAMAYAALFRAWGADYQGEDACLQAEGLGLRCRTARGGLDELRRSNRPAVLHMRDDQGNEFHAALIELGPKTATFAVGNEDQDGRPRRAGGAMVGVLQFAVALAAGCARDDPAG